MGRRKRNFMGMMAPSGYQVQRSLRFRASASAYLNRTFGAPTLQSKWTLNAWVKRGRLTDSYPILMFDLNNYIHFNSADKLQLVTAAAIQLTSTSVYRDPSAHGCLTISYDNAASPKWQFYWNGVSIMSGGPTETSFNSAIAHYLGKTVGGQYFDGYLSEVRFIDGQALTPSSFAATDLRTGQWLPIPYAGTYGTNGFYLDFRDNSSTTNLCLDRSGNGNNWTPNNISVTAGVTYDSMLDVPTQWEDGGNGRGNYCTLNPLAPLFSFCANSTIRNGNLEAVSIQGADWEGCKGPVLPYGKWNLEFALKGSAAATFGYRIIGLLPAATQNIGNSPVGFYTPVLGYSLALYPIAGNPSTNPVGLWSANVRTAIDADVSADADGTVYMMAVDMTLGDGANKVWWGRAGTWFNSGNPASGTSATYSTLANDLALTLNLLCIAGNGITFNFGQRPFTYTPPTGFKALNTLNLPEPTILLGNRYMDIDTYTGTGATRTKTGLYFQPDLAWFKGRSGATDHALYDSVRGVENRLESNNTDVEVTGDTTGLTAFTSDGYTTGLLAQLNTNAATYAAWLFKAGGTAASNTSGTITSSVSAGVAQGISVLTYTGTGANATVGHGIGVAPKMVIVKERTNDAGDWYVYHASNTAAPETDYLLLNSTAATADLDTIWNDTAPSSTVFSIGTHDDVNGSTDTYVAYCFTDVAGFSAFGSYVGNGSADGPFIYTGFDVAFLLVKCSTAVDDWRVYDRTRPGYNVQGGTLLADTAGAETTTAEIDFVSNGFKARITTTPNAAQTYVYAAFAKNPFKYTNAR